MVFDETYNTLLLRCNNQVLVVLEELDSRLRDEHMETVLDSI